MTFVLERNEARGEPQDYVVQILFPDSSYIMVTTYFRLQWAELQFLIYLKGPSRADQPIDRLNLEGVLCSSSEPGLLLQGVIILARRKQLVRSSVHSNR